MVGGDAAPRRDARVVGDDAARPLIARGPREADGLPPRTGRGWAGVLAVLAALALAVSVGLALGAPGDLDTSFDGDGKRTIDYGGEDRGQAVALQPNGKILVAGYGGSNTAMTVTRLNPEGSLDNGFDGDGTSGVDLGGDERAYALALQPDGKIVLVGETFPPIGFGPDIAVARLNPDGSLDAGFNGNGVRLIDYGLTFDGGRAVALQPDGKILVVGFSGLETPAMKVTRLNPNGSNDMSFGAGGTSSVNPPGDEQALGVALQRDGKIVIVGDRVPPGGVRTVVLVVRLDPGGAIDRDFGIGGTRSIDYGAGVSARGRAVTLQADGKIVVAGSGGADTAMMVTRLNPDGSNDTSFDGDGTSGLDLGLGESANAVALQPDGKVVVAGSTGARVAIGRLQPGGSPDTTFDFDGRQTVGFGLSDVAFGLALQPNGRIVVAGKTDGNVAVARLEGDPPPARGGAGSGSGSGPGVGGSAGGRATYRCAGKRATIVGTSRRDALRGTRRTDVIVALGGNDLVRAGAATTWSAGAAAATACSGRRAPTASWARAGAIACSGGRAPTP